MHTVYSDTIEVSDITGLEATLLDRLHYGYMVTGFTLPDGDRDTVSYLEKPFCVVRKPKNWEQFDPDSRSGKMKCRSSRFPRKEGGDW